MKRQKPKVFIGSSVEALGIAYAIQNELEHDAEPTVWSQGVFNLTKPLLSDLLACLDKYDAAIFVLSPDDVVLTRNSEKVAVRDNIIFELGLFIGRLGPERTYMLQPRGIQDFHLPTDLLGVTPGTYDASRDDGNSQAAVGPFCFQVRNKIREISGSKATETSDSSYIDVRYNDLMEKLIQLGGYNRLIENKEIISDNVLEKYHALREDIFRILERDFEQLLEMLASSGIINVIFGDIFRNEYMLMEVRSIDFLENHFIQLNAGEIHTSSMEIPTNIIEWFGDRYLIEKKPDHKFKAVKS